jgi:hypothetical protein
MYLRYMAKMKRWLIEFAGQKRTVSGKDLKSAIRESFKKKPPEFLGTLIRVVDKQTNIETWMSTDSVVRVIK